MQKYRPYFFECIKKLSDEINNLKSIFKDITINNNIKPTDVEEFNDKFYEEYELLGKNQEERTWDFYVDAGTVSYIFNVNKKPANLVGLGKKIEQIEDNIHKKLSKITKNICWDGNCLMGTDENETENTILTFNFTISATIGYSQDKKQIIKSIGLNRYKKWIYANTEKSEELLKSDEAFFDKFKKYNNNTKFEPITNY